MSSHLFEGLRLLFLHLSRKPRGSHLGGESDARLLGRLTVIWIFHMRGPSSVPGPAATSVVLDMGGQAEDLLFSQRAYKTLIFEAD